MLAGFSAPCYYEKTYSILPSVNFVLDKTLNPTLSTSCQNKWTSCLLRSQAFLSWLNIYKKILIFMMHNKYYYIDHVIYFHNRLILRYKYWYYFLYTWSIFFKKAWLEEQGVYLFWVRGSTLQTFCIPVLLWFFCSELWILSLKYANISD